MLWPSLKTTVLATAALACASSVLAEQQVLKIGHGGLLLGPNAFAGRDNDNGVDLTAEELNAHKISVGSTTLKFEVVSEDDQCDA
ncbi:MAG: branched-chain amino acid ABC transporter substrate-binding protein, partial [Proteobacteria bacterium]|nr:branched-chain amino acid ABC transporter substrate-binding protein [Pseudomonadota bacterium]